METVFDRLPLSIDPVFVQLFQLQRLEFFKQRFI